MGSAFSNPPVQMRVLDAGRPAIEGDGERGASTDAEHDVTEYSDAAEEVLVVL